MTETARLCALVRERSLIQLPAGQEIRLASGRMGRFYFNMKATIFHPEGAYLIASLIVERLRGAGVDAVGGLEMGAVPVVAAVALRSHEMGVPVAGFFVRKQPKAHGTKERIEGILSPGERVALLEDVTTTGGSVLKAVAAVREIGCTVARVITLVDRQEGAAETLAAHGLTLEALLTADDIGVVR
ncbi:MAG: orotate phosphoribosyltransferase [Alphaproteobacteria bacterium]|nr:orotate phosphoribosyltransferase [Alphaproteobacteria bacterium]